MKRGYFEIGIYCPKTDTNVGTLWRSAYQLGASGVFTIEKRYNRQSSDTTNSKKHIPLRHYNSFDAFQENIPIGARLVGIEMGGRNLSGFAHPEQCVYLLGAEDFGLPQEILSKCWAVVSLESARMNSFNVAVAGSLVMYNRMYGS